MALAQEPTLSEGLLGGTVGRAVGGSLRLAVRQQGGGLAGRLSVGERRGGRLLGLELRLLGLAAVVLGDVVDDQAVGDAHDEEEPEQVQGLQGGEETECDDVAEEALVLLRLPVELVRADGPEFGQEREENLQVEVVSHVDPYAHEDDEVRGSEVVIDVVQRLGGLKQRSRVNFSTALTWTRGGEGGRQRTARKKSLMSWVT